LKNKLETSGLKYQALASREDLKEWSGIIKNKSIFFLDEVSEEINLLILGCPHSVLSSVLGDLSLLELNHIVIANSGLGRSFELAERRNNSDISCFSNFFGAAKYSGSEEVTLKTIKKETFIYTNSIDLREFFEFAFKVSRVNLSFTQTSLEAEFRNITLYAHPAFSTSSICLEYSFGISNIKKYMYKIFPEGPVEPRQTLKYASLSNMIQKIMGNLHSIFFIIKTIKCLIAI